MPKDKDSKERKRLVVEEVVSAGEKNELLGVVKEKVEELQDLTQDIGQSVEKSSEVQEEIVKAAEKVEPVAPPQDMRTSMPARLNVWVILIPGVLLLGALLGGIVFYEKSIKPGQEANPTPIATAQSTVLPSASPSAKLDLTKYPINVENGSGIPGTASSAKDLLTKAGFKVSATGNANTYDFTDTIIETKADVPAEFITKLTTTLSGIYKVGTPKSLPASSTNEVVVIVGSSKSQ